MIDLRGIARHLRLPVEQLRLAADLLEQGYQPGFIERYRADETGSLPRSVLWALKLEVDRQQRLQVAREKATSQLPKDASLDEEAFKFLERATTEVEIEATLRSFRARRALEQAQERTGQAGQLLEKLISYQGPAINDLNAWVATEMSVGVEAAPELLEQTRRLVASLIQCDTGLNERIRREIQKKGQIAVEFLELKQENDSDQEKSDDQDADLSDHSEESSENESSEVAAEQEPSTSDQPEGNSDKSTGDASASSAEVAETESEPTVSEPESANIEEIPAQDSMPTASGETQVEPVDSAENAAEAVPSNETRATPADGVPTTTETATATNEDETAAAQAAADAELLRPFSVKKAAKAAKTEKAKSKKTPAKMTPRQRRRRWLIAMLQPMKSLKRPVAKLTAYQQLMLGRGRRSQLVKTPLKYDTKGLFAMARDTFVSAQHPLAGWFEEAVTASLAQSWMSKIEADALSDLEEFAQEKLLENAADQLRINLMRRPVRGHVIMVVDTVGPKAAAVAIVDHAGNVLATDEISCSAHPDTVNQNVVRLGELAHRYKVTLVALTNGPARRFLVLSVRELMKQSVSSGLRWTMADRSGAEAYAASRIALRELSVYNRRDRAAIWIGRCLQNPLSELLKGDINRLRLGSYQRELPQEPLKQLVRETIADCVCTRGVDTHRASIDELLYVFGVEYPQAQQIANLSSAGQLESRQQLLESVTDWPEPQARQAIGLLRVFGSPQALDATAIHPDDYRLAERLIENTELSAPANAPDGWAKPAIQPTDTTNPTAILDAPSESPIESLHADPSSADSTDAVIAVEPTEQPVAPESTEKGAEAADNQEAAGESAESAESVSETHSEAPTSTAPNSTETPSTDSESSEVPSAEGAPETTTEATESDPNSQAPAEIALPGVKAEYPEDIQAEVSSTPPIDVEKLARGWQVGREKLRWVADCLHNPFADARLFNSPIPMLTEMPTLSSLEPGMCVWAVVVGVADFGAFVELGPDCSGLIHISRLSADYVEDPHQVVQVGDLMMAWVVAVDEKKNRVALTALSPAERAAADAAAAKRSEERREQRGGEGQRRGPRGGNQSSGQAGDGQSRGGAPARSGSGSRGGDGRGGDNRGGGPRGGGRGRGPQGGRSSGPPRPSKPVVVTSKKPKAPISEAMKEGEEPLRSFSDLMQFYAAKRTDEAPTVKPSESKPVTPADPQQVTSTASDAENTQSESESES